MIGTVRTFARWLTALTVLALVGLAGGGAAPHGQDSGPATGLTEKMKAPCVGRFLIEVPAQTNVTLSYARASGFDISRTKETSDQFRSRLAAREAQLSAKPNMLGHKNIESTKELVGEHAMLTLWRTISSSIRLRVPHD